MKKILAIVSNTFLSVKEWSGRSKKLLKKLAIGCVAAICILLVAILGLNIYLDNKYPANIILEDAFVDISSLDFQFSDRDLNSAYDEEEATKITFAEGENVILKKAGTYILSGNLTGGMLIVEAGEEDKLQVVLDNCTINNEAGPAFYVKSADKVFITLASDSVNTISDGKEYEYVDGETNVDGAIFSKADLVINGSGRLVVEGNYKHGIVSKDDLVIGSGAYDITSVKKALNGKDCVKIYSGDIEIKAGSDGICSDNSEDANRGFVYIEGGNINITSGNDGIQAENILKFDNPVIEICSGGGSANAPVREDNQFARGPKGDDEEAEEVVETTESTKGIKSATDIIITDGEYIIDSVDDTVHANGSIKIEGGNLYLKSGDDGIHADNTLQIVEGNIDISKSYEGLEAYQIAVSGGDISILSTDDGVNASSGSDTSTFLESIKKVLASSLNGKLEISGGNLFVNAEGDGLDSNGVMTISGGTTFVAGPSSDGNAIIDCDGDRVVNGGIVVCIGSSDDDNEFSEVNNQSSIATTFAKQEAGTTIQICDSNGNVIVSFEAPKAYNCILATAPEIQEGSTYMLKVSGEVIATVEN